MARRDITVPVSRSVAKLRTRVATEYIAETDLERKAIWARVIMSLDQVKQSVLDVNLYDESKSHQFTAETCPGRPCGACCDHTGRIPK